RRRSGPPGPVPAAAPTVRADPTAARRRAVMPRTRTVVLAGVTAAVSAAVFTLSAQAAAPAADERAAAADCAYPSEVLDLSDWKLTLPTGEEEDPTEITQPELASFS